MLWKEAGGNQPGQRCRGWNPEREPAGAAMPRRNPGDPEQQQCFEGDPTRGPAGIEIFRRNPKGTDRGRKASAGTRPGTLPGGDADEGTHARRRKPLLLRHGGRSRDSGGWWRHQPPLRMGVRRGRCRDAGIQAVIPDLIRNPGHCGRSGDPSGVAQGLVRAGEGPRIKSRGASLERRHLILASLNSTCLRATGSYFRKVIFSVMLRGFFFVT